MLSKDPVGVILLLAIFLYVEVLMISEAEPWQ